MQQVECKQQQIPARAGWSKSNWGWQRPLTAKAANKTTTIHMNDRLLEATVIQLM